MVSLFHIDGTYTKEMLEQPNESGIKIEEVYGDKAYFRKPILDTIKKQKAEAFIPVSACAYRTTINKKKYARKKGDTYTGGYKYYFEMNQCKTCPKHNQCAKKSTRKILDIGMNTVEFYEISQKQKTKEFKEKYKKRASIEGKNAELKRFHGLYRARGYGLLSISKQSKLAAIAVNIKRIAGIVSLTILMNFNYFNQIYKKIENYCLTEPKAA